MLYFIDGYNVTRRDPATRGLDIEVQRRELETRMRLHGSKLLPGAEYRIVWDGSGGEGLAHPARERVEYTRLPTADDAIVKKVAAARGRVGVVTSDHGLANRCRAVALKGVEIVESDRLFARAAGKARVKKAKRGMSPEVGIPKGANKINEELKEIWGIE